jgi:hypothetical protein
MSFPFCGVLHQAQNTGIRNCIVDVLRFPTSFDKSGGVENLKTSGNGGHLLTFKLRQFRHADIASDEPRQQSKPGWLPECPEHCGSDIQLTRAR